MLKINLFHLAEFWHLFRELSSQTVYVISCRLIVLELYYKPNGYTSHRFFRLFVTYFCMYSYTAKEILSSYSQWVKAVPLL